jgi:hypothetical protein
MKKTLSLICAAAFGGITLSAAAQQPAPAPAASTDPIVAKRMADKEKREAVKAKTAPAKKAYEDKVAQYKQEMEAAPKDGKSDPVLEFRKKRAAAKKEYDAAVKQARQAVYGTAPAKGKK